MPEQIVIVPAPCELVRGEGHWTTTDPLGQAGRALAPELGPTAYEVVVSPGGARLTGGSPEALRYAEQTFRQLVDSAPPADGAVAPSAHVTTGTAVPCVTIRDAPAFAWRGLMLDVARHFMPKEFVLRLVDALELHRMNVLHLHLTDDQGWRVQVDAYPRLTEVGAWRERTMVGHMDSNEQTTFDYDDERHGGFYTKDDLREIVGYAAERGVVVVPEIDLPGHMQAAVAAYPELGNDPNRQLGVREVWGISDHVLAVSDGAVEFARTVIREVLEVFPGRYIHLGGDEVPVTEWEESPAVQARRRELGLADTTALQGWFTGQVSSVLAEDDRRLVGWDELLEAGCPPDTVIMAWRGPDRGEAAARAGHDVVMAPNQSVYFDHYQADPATEPLAIGGLTTLGDVLDLEIVPPALTPEEAARILGVQCQVWTEYMATPEHVAYMLFPRLCAFAERAWGSPRTTHQEFTERLPRHLARLEALGLGYRPLD